MWHKNSNTKLVLPNDNLFWDSLWQTDEMKEIMTTDPQYRQILQRAKSLAWWWADSTQAYERFHFSAWFGNTILRREYANPLHQDLFHLHDILHAVTFDNHPEGSEKDWRNRMRANEVAVSLETEVLFYFRFPHLREKSLDFKIWYDSLCQGVDEKSLERLDAFETRLMEGAAVEEQELRNAHPEGWFLEYPDFGSIPLSYDQLWNLRRAISLSPNLNDEVEVTLASYEDGTENWADGWAGSWRDVEMERQIFQDFCRSGKVQTAVNRRHQIWELVSNSDGIPYGEIAQGH